MAAHNPVFPSGRHGFASTRLGLDSGHLGGLAIDVAPAEPLPPDHRARHHPRAIVTSHVGYYWGSVIDAKLQSVGKVIRVLAGQPPLEPVFAHAMPTGSEEKK